MYRINRKHFFGMAMGVGLAAVMVVLCLPATGRASFYNEKTYVTFSGPVQIPGQVLSAGTYVFKLAMPSATSNMVQIWNKDQTHLYATIVAVPDYRLRPRAKTVIKLERLGSHNPEALEAWFYPGANYGDLFLYPHTGTVAAARPSHAPAS